MNLLPCPFCGGAPDTDDGETGGTVECCKRDCPVQPSIFRDHEPSYDGLSLAADDWNRRSGDGIIDRIRDVARIHGWAIGVHGSLVRDIDLIGVPWTADAATPETLVEAIMRVTDYNASGHRLGAPRPGGRRSILLMHPDAIYEKTPKGTWTPPAIDLSLMPSAVTQDAAPNSTNQPPSAAPTMVEPREAT